MMAKAAPTLAGLRVLVVEDEMLIADHIEGLLEELGCEIAGPVPTVAAALAAVRNGHIDAALLDANLNGQTSAPIAEALRERGVPFVVVTGYSQLDLAAPLGDAPRLAKPFDDAAFETTLAAAFL